MDIKELNAHPEKIVDVNAGNYRTYEAIHRNPLPVIVAVHGFVLGGGIGMSGAADIVVAAEDPGVQNWLDTEGRATGMVSYRWVFTDDAPSPTSTVVPVAELRDHLPADTPAFGPADRRAQVEARQAAIASRFRT